ncbi:MAG: FkbM family methyltransferase [Pseudomonadales bacterium]
MGQAQINVVRVPYQDTELVYEASNDAVIWRANTLYQKEPDTVAWISQFARDEVFFDIGANVGMYSVLAAKGRGVRVFAFEPESQNYALLNRNILYNQIQQLCIAFPLALGNEVKVDRLYLSEFGLGGSCHTFGDNIDFHLQQRSIEIAQGCVSFPLDQLVADGVVPSPDHIKIDVDGLEHVVLAGACEVLASQQLKSVLVELNTHLPEHQALIRHMAELGFEYDQRQVDVAVRQQGAFQGVGNYIFYKPDAHISFADIVVPEAAAAASSAAATAAAPSAAAPAPANKTNSADGNRVASHVLQRLSEIELVTDPYPYFYLTEVFPQDFYQQMMAMKPSNEELVSISQTGRTRGYDERFVMPFADGLARLVDANKVKFWSEFRSWFLNENFMVAMIKVFQQAIVQRGVKQLNVRGEGMFMRDHQGYQIGPHTDSPKRLLSVMFYLPEDQQHTGLGTTVYRPRQAGMQCSGARHHGFGDFVPEFTAPYAPNSAFGFLKTENSFHGVGQLTEAYLRDTLVYIVKHK